MVELGVVHVKRLRREEPSVHVDGRGDIDAPHNADEEHELEANNRQVELEALEDGPWLWQLAGGDMAHEPKDREGERAEVAHGRRLRLVQEHRRPRHRKEDGRVHGRRRSAIDVEDGAENDRPSKGDKGAKRAELREELAREAVLDVAGLHAGEQRDEEATRERPHEDPRGEVLHQQRLRLLWLLRGDDGFLVAVRVVHWQHPAHGRAQEVAF